MRQNPFGDEVALDGIPVIADFAVTLGDETPDGGLHLQYVSAAHGRLAGFPAWDHADRDLRHFTIYDVPLGSIVEPYEDADEGWRIVIFEHEGFVYVGEGDSASGPVHAMFRVPRARYASAWVALIEHANPLTRLDE